MVLERYMPIVAEGAGIYFKHFFNAENLVCQQHTVLCTEVLQPAGGLIYLASISHRHNIRHQ